MTSQFHEDRHIEAIFTEIGFGSKKLADIGARYAYSNAENLILKHGFEATLVEAGGDACDELRRHFPGANVVHKTVTPQDVNDHVARDVWFLSIDIDSCDWWVWANLQARPALVIVETNPCAGVFVAKMNCGSKDANGYGMSLDAAKALGELKGYDYVGRTEVNAFFVRKDLKCQYRLPEQKGHSGVPCGVANNVF